MSCAHKGFERRRCIDLRRRGHGPEGTPGGAVESMEVAIDRGNKNNVEEVTVVCSGGGPSIAVVGSAKVDLSRKVGDAAARLRVEGDDFGET